MRTKTLPTITFPRHCLAYAPGPNGMEPFFIVPPTRARPTPDEIRRDGIAVSGLNSLSPDVNVRATEAFHKALEGVIGPLEEVKGPLPSYHEAFALLKEQGIHALHGA